MKKVALFDDAYIVERVIVIDDSVELQDALFELGIKTPYKDLTNEEVLTGQQFSFEHDRFIPLNFRPNFVWNEQLWRWDPPISAPSDATWIPEWQEKPEGHDELSVKRVYYWMDKYQAWGLAPCACNPKPSDEHYWNPLEQEWQLPNSEMPEGNYTWDAIEQEWFEAFDTSGPSGQ